DLAVEPRSRQPPGEQRQCLAHVVAGDEVADAVVRATAEAEVPGALHGDVERGRRIRPWVGAGDDRQQVQHGAGGDLHALELEILERLPGYPGDGRVDPHDLLDRAAAEVRAPRQQLPLVEVLHE